LAPHRVERRHLFGDKSRSEQMEDRLRSWDFCGLVRAAEQETERLTTREEMLVCYARERCRDHDGWLRSITRLRQRVFQNEWEHLAFRALSLQSLKDLKKLADDLKRTLCFPQDLLLQIAWVRVADRLASLQELQESWELYACFPGTGAASEWQRLTELKATIVSYLNGKLDNDTVIGLLRSSGTQWAETPLAEVYGLAFHLYIASISARWFDQIRLQNHLRKTLAELVHSEDQSQLLAVAAYLLNPEQGLGAALWRSQLPETGTPEQPLFDHIPEMLWLTHCMDGIEKIQRASQNQSLPALKEVLFQQERLGNGLLAACARSRLLGHILHHYSLRREPELMDFWFQELRLLQSMPYNELQSFGALLHAAHFYRQGEFHDCLQTLRRARRLSQDRLRRRIISLWLAHARGRMPRQVPPELVAVSLRLLRYFFAPNLKSLGHSLYVINDVYKVDLSLYPVLNRLLQQILRHPQKALLTQDVQDLVWRQTAYLEGWKQKLRNAVSRLRYQFRFMMAPLVMQSHGMLRLNLDALSFEPMPANLQAERRQEILRALQHGPRSMEGIREATRIPASTLRRYLRDLTKEGVIAADAKQNRTFFTSVSAAGSKY
jgi:DNA-binding transcriptional ArsR family regulator